MASLNVHMPTELREFVERRTKEGRFSTPTEYVRHLIREDEQRAAEQRIDDLFLEGVRSGRARGSVDDLFKRLHRLIDKHESERKRAGKTMTRGNAKTTRSHSGG